MRIACCQLDAKSMDAAADVWPAIETQVAAAAAAAAELLILPEIAYPSYLLESRERYLRDDIERSDAVLNRFSTMARSLGVWLVAGFVEECGDDLLNSAAVIDAAGDVKAIARKQFLWDCDNEWFSPGHESVVVETPWGRMGILICADLRMPEISATLVARGAEFIVQPTAWVNAALGTGGYRNIQPEFLLRARAIEFGVPYASCSKSGRERSRMGYVGQSMIVDAEGATLAQAPIEGDTTVFADITPGKGRLAQLRDGEHGALRCDPVETPMSDDNASVEFDPSDDIDDIDLHLDSCGVRTSCMMAGDLKSYVRARIAALAGAQMLTAVGQPPDASLVCARAAENRVFVCIGDQRGASIVVDPTGKLLYEAGGPSAPITIRPGEADRKAFTPATPIWTQRRVDEYTLVAEP